VSDIRSAFTRNVQSLQALHSVDPRQEAWRAQAQALLGVLHIPRNGLLLAVDLFNAKVAKCRNHGGQKKHYGQQRAKGDETVLPRGRLHAPPAAPQTQGLGAGRNVKRRQGLLGHMETSKFK